MFDEDSVHFEQVKPDLSGFTLQKNSRLQALVERNCVVSRVFFVEKVLKLKLDPWQRQVLTDLDAGATRISIRSGHGPGKTFVCAICALHYLLFRIDVKVAITAPTSSQLKDGLFPEVVKWVERLPDWLQSRLHITSSRIVRKDKPLRDFITFRTARKEKPEALQGIHATFILLIADEAAGVDDAVYLAAQGTLSTSGAIFILIGNPSRLEGFFYDTHHSMKHAWRTYRITSFDSSNVDIAFVNMIRDAYGEDHDQWRIRVMGEFPLGEETTLISREHTMLALQRGSSYDLDLVLSTYRPTWGVDPARGGDPFAIVKTAGNVVYGAQEWRERDTTVCTNKIFDMWTGCNLKPEYIVVETNGVGGPIADRLTEMGLPVLPIDVSNTASAKERYGRVRDELWWAAKEAFELAEYIIAPNSELDMALAEKLAVELSSPLEIFSPSGKAGVEPKKLTKARLRRSPNLADAFIMTRAVSVSLGAGAHSRNKSVSGIGSYGSFDNELPYITANI